MIGETNEITRFEDCLAELRWQKPN